MELKMYIEILARRWRIVLLVAVVVICLAAVGSRFISPMYQATAVLRVITPSGGGSGDVNYQTTFATRLINTYAQIAVSEQIKNEMKEKMGTNKLPDITVKVVPESEILQVIVESENPALAAKTANTLVSALLSYQDNTADTSNSQELNILSTRREELQDELLQAQLQHEELVQTYSKISADMAVLNRTIQLKESSYINLQDQYEQTVVSEAVFTSSTVRATKEILSEEIDRIEKELTALNQQYKDLSTKSNEYQQKISLALQTIQSIRTAYLDLLFQYDSVSLANSRKADAQNVAIVSPATEPLKPSGTGQLFVLGLGLICGVIVGVIAAFVIDSLDTRIFSLEQVKNAVAIPIITSISKFNNPQLGTAPDFKDPFTQRDYWMLRTKLQAVLKEGSLKTVMLTSPNRSEGKSTLVHELASSLAQGNMKVLVVDTDLHKPQQHKLFNVTAVHGLADFLNGKQDNVKDVIVKDVKPGVDLLPSLAECDNPAELLHSPRLKILFEALKGYDVVLFDTAAFLAVPEALELAKKTDGVVVVAQSGYTTIEDIQSIVSQLESIDAKLIGLVVNQIPGRKTSYYYHPDRFQRLMNKVKKITVHLF